VGINPEQLLISAVLLEKDHVTPSANGISVEMFHAFPDEWEFIESYIQRHSRMVSKAAFKQKFPMFVIKKVDDVKHYCDEVRKQNASTQLTSSIQDAIDLLRGGDVVKALKGLHTATMQTEVALGGSSGDSDIFEDWEPIYNEVERRADRVKNFGISGIPTGFPTLDARTGGPQPGHLWVFAARLGQGKTWSLVRTAVAAAFSGLAVQYDSLEQTREEIALRVFTFASSEYGKEVFRNIDQSMGTVTNLREYKEFLASMRDHINGKFHVADTSRGPISPMAIAAQFERNRPDVCFLDYLTLMEHNDTEAWRGVAKLSSALKGTAQRYGIPIVAAAQLNRTAVDKKNPAGPEALAESDAIGRDADAVITMVQLSRRVIMMKLAKYRHGRDGFHWYCKFLPNTGHFEEISFDDAQDVIGEDKEDEDEEPGALVFKPRQRGSFSANQAGTLAKPRIIVPRKSIIVSSKTVITPKKRVIVRRSS
jgi:replicative DNA helicase